MTKLSAIELTPRDIFKHIQNDGMVLTGNKRLASALLSQYESFLVEQGLTAWKTPLIIPLNTWLMMQWEELKLSLTTALPKLLNANQESFLWEKIILSSDLSHALLRPEAMAKEVAKAWRIQQEWELPFSEDEFKDNEDTLAYYQWANDFIELCSTSNFLPTSALINQVIDALEQKQVELSKASMLIGFDELSPIQDKLVKCMQGYADVKWVTINYSFTHLVPTYSGLNSSELNSSRYCHQLAFSSQEEEIETMVRWLGDKLEQEADATIAIVVADLENNSNIISQYINNILLQSNLNCSSLNSVNINNISLGTPLLSYDLIQSAIRMLNGLNAKWSLEDCLYLIKSSYIVSADEIHQAALLASKLVDLNCEQLKLSTIIFYANQADQVWFCPKLSQQLLAWQDFIDTHLLQQKKDTKNNKEPGNYKEARNLDFWKKTIFKSLEIVNWCQIKRLSSDEFQLYEAWKTLVSNLNQFDNLLFNFDGKLKESIPLSDLLKLLSSQLSGQIFQSESDENLPVQILGLYESIGLSFDYCWVMGLQESNWPAKARPNVFLPYSLQQKFATPQSSQQRELMVAKTVTERLKNIAPTTFFSFHQKEADQNLSISPLIEDLSLLNIEQLGQYKQSSWWDSISQSQQNESFTDTQAPIFTDEYSPGGQKILTNQSLCPFKAFAEIRLNAKSLKSTQIGLDPMQRGNLVHQCMEAFWQKIKSQNKLLQLDKGQLDTQLKDIIDEVMTQLVSKSLQSIGIVFQAIEKERLFELLSDWIEEEKKRQAFDVLDFEKKELVTRQGLSFNTIIDRIDKETKLDGSINKILIDYKTGTVSPNKWLGERPEDMQLPLYSTLVDINELVAICYAQIKVDSIKYLGIVKTDELIPGLPPKSNKVLKAITENWESTLLKWQQQIDQLIIDYKQGKAEVDPIAGKRTCESSFCDLMPLCRINELIE